jgi:hypothetical protein
MLLHRTHIKKGILTAGNGEEINVSHVCLSTTTGTYIHCNANGEVMYIVNSTIYS